MSLEWAVKDDSSRQIVIGNDSERQNSEIELNSVLKQFYEEGSFLAFERTLSDETRGSRCLLEESLPKDLTPKEVYYRLYWTNIGLIREAVDTGLYSLPDPPDYLRPTQRILTLSEAFHCVPQCPLDQQVGEGCKWSKRNKSFFSRLLNKFRRRNKCTSNKLNKK